MLGGEIQANPVIISGLHLQVAVEPLCILYFNYFVVCHFPTN
ncbi:hypothetical protein EVA_03268 [gut metagenome]|uniref:Uncharacterized protein n=1 Tax=gut metagenome TaxID=749906 RepID=J9H4D1_9ZZZZ